MAKSFLVSVMGYALNYNYVSQIVSAKLILSCSHDFSATALLVYLNASLK